MPKVDDCIVNLGPLGAEIHDLYNDWDTPVVYNIDILEKIAKLSKRIGTVTKRIFDGDVKRGEIASELFDITNDTLQHAVTTGFGLEQKRNKVLEQQLRNNVGIFAVFKSYNQTKVLQEALVDDNGNIRSFAQFKKAANKITNVYNKNWLKTEYNTAIARARTAEQFDRFEKDKDLYPNLKWIPSRSANPRDTHKALYGIIRPIGDEFWKKHYPGNIWNCKCDIGQTNDRATGSNTVRKATKGLKVSPAGIDQNPSEKGEVFTKTSPFIRPTSDKERHQAIERFKLEYPMYLYDKETQVSTSLWADPVDLKENVGVARLLKKAFPKLDIKLRPHVDGIETGIGKNKRSNPEYLINDTLGDLKHAEKYNVRDIYSSAKDQGCKMMVIKIESEMSFDECFRKLNGQIQLRLKNKKFAITEIYVLKDNVIKKYNPL